MDGYDHLVQQLLLVWSTQSLDWWYTTIQHVSVGVGGSSTYFFGPMEKEREFISLYVRWYKLPVPGSTERVSTQQYINCLDLFWYYYTVRVVTRTCFCLIFFLKIDPRGVTTVWQHLVLNFSKITVKLYVTVLVFDILQKKHQPNLHSMSLICFSQ